MFDDRLEQFSRERLGGRPIPDDLRIFLTAHWEGRPMLYDAFEIEFLEPGETNPLLDTSYLGPEALANPDIMANCAAHERMAQHLLVFAKHPGGTCYGYWAHPDEPVDRPLAVVQCDSEGQYLEMDGVTFAEACVADHAFEEDDVFAELAAEFNGEGIAIAARSLDDLGEIRPARSPHDVHHEFYLEEREKRGLSRSF